MSLAEALLAADAGKLKQRQTRDYEVSRLSALIGEPFILHLRQIPNRRVREIQDMSMTIEDGKPSVNQYALSSGLLVAGIANTDFDNKDVLKKYGAATKKELFDLLFNAGEVQDIAEAISELCGFGKAKKLVEEVKN